ncbi:MAG: hypothetical protein J6B23_03295, partial [Clostridia bacterium]|nr:hypothetical protein [Clostridia bacterium]
VGRPLLYIISFLNNSSGLRNTEAHNLCELFRRRPHNKKFPDRLYKNISGGRGLGLTAEAPQKNNIIMSLLNTFHIHLGMIVYVIYKLL